jgi:opacity protein-like surface antigen
MKQILVVLVLMVFSTTSYSSDWYGGIQYSEVDYSESGANLDFSTVSFIAGYELDNVVAIEARYGEGLDGDDIGGTNIEVDSVYGLYTILSLPNETNVEPYLVLGYTEGELAASGFGSDSENGFSYGAGISFKLAESLTVRAEYMRLLSGDDWDFDALSASLVYNF